MLERLGHSAVLCDNGPHAVQRLRHEPFDVVLMDLHMPVMDGFDATRAMRALSAPAGAVRIIALSADAFKKSRNNAISAGLDGFLAKPVSIETLAAVLDER